MHEHEHDNESCACGCGHEHHHEHEHEHHHEHEHENCSCGHEHGHSHEQGCNCSECASAAKTGFRLTRVEGATAAAVRFPMAGTQGVVEVEIVTRVKALCQDVMELGGLVGHIKGAVNGEGDVTTFSCTGGAVTLSRKEHTACTVDLVAIVVGLSDADLEKAVRGRFPEVG